MCIRLVTGRVVEESYYAPPPRIGGIKRWCASNVWRLSVAHIWPKSRTERPRKTKIGTEVAHVTRDSDTTFVKRSKVNLRGIRILWRPPAQLVRIVLKEFREGEFRTRRAGEVRWCGFCLAGPWSSDYSQSRTVLHRRISFGGRYFTGRKPFLSTNYQCQSTEGIFCRHPLQL